MTRTRGWRCLVCGGTRDIAEPFPWRCPNATRHDRYHVLVGVDGDENGDDGDRAVPAPAAQGPVNPFVTYDGDLAWAAFADAHGIDAAARRQLVADLDDTLRLGGGIGFTTTPFGRSHELSERLGFTDGGGIWVKDETGGVAGSHKARHLVTILLHLLAAERAGHLPERAPLAIASCGNAALAAATLAAAADWPIDVYVPTWMNPAFGAELDRLGARIHACARRTSDPPGDPAMLRFRDAVDAGAIPFTVQGPENALCLDGGRTLGWEIVDQLRQTDGRDARPDRVYVQVGGGALAACVGRAIVDRLGAAPMRVVQAAGCAPLARAWKRAADDLELGTSVLGHQWAELMTPWADPQSSADGILDDETYDWLGIVDVVVRSPSGSAPVVASEADIVAAHQLATGAGFGVSPTGSAGLAGVLAEIDTVAPSERVVVIMSGVQR